MLFSADIETRGPNLLTVQVMAQAGVHISKQRSKHVDKLKGIQFDHVVTVCDHAHESCPLFPGRTKNVHAGLDDPRRRATAAKWVAEAFVPYRRVRDEVRDMVEQFPEVSQLLSRRRSNTQAR